MVGIQEKGVKDLIKDLKNYRDGIQKDNPCIHACP